MPDQRIRGLREVVRTQLWPAPTMAVVAALAAGVLLPLLDAAVDGSMPPALTALLFSGGADAARTVLSAVAGSLITVTSLTFSLTVVTLQLASSQYSPRLLRTFTRDRYVHVTLALFLGTFVYALTVLRTVRNSADARAEFVPQVSVTAAFVLTVASVLGLVVFLAHLARQIRVESVLRTVLDEGLAAVRQVLDEPSATARDDPPSPWAPRDAAVVPATGTGFLVRVDEDELLSAAVEAGALLEVQREPGEFVVAGTSVARVWPAEPDTPLRGEALDRLVDRVRAAVTTGPERTSAQDVGFALRQLTDVVNKALSPGINDPTTAIHALGHSSALLCQLARRDLGARVLRDDDGRVRAVLARPGFADLVELGLAQPCRYGASDPAVLARVLGVLGELAQCAPPDRQGIIAARLARVRATAAAQDYGADEHRRLRELAEQVERVVDERTGAVP